MYLAECKMYINISAKEKKNVEVNNNVEIYSQDKIEGNFFLFSGLMSRAMKNMLKYLRWSMVG